MRLYGSSTDIISTWYSSNAAGGTQPWQAIEVVITQEKRKRQVRERGRGGGRRKGKEERRRGRKRKVL